MSSPLHLVFKFMHVKKSSKLQIQQCLWLKANVILTVGKE